MKALMQVTRKQVRPLALQARLHHLEPKSLDGPNLQARTAKAELPHEDALAATTAHIKQATDTLYRVHPDALGHSEPSWREYKLPPLEGSRQKAITVCLQAYVFIAFEGGSPPSVRMVDPYTKRPEECCTLFGMQYGALAVPHRSKLNAVLENTMPLWNMPAVAPLTLWAHLFESMTPQGQELFRHFNSGQAAPTTATECYRRLQEYSQWLLNQAD